MTIKRTLHFVMVATVTAACASRPTGPSVMVLPGSGKNLEQFRVEDSRCRQFAANEVEATKSGSVPAQHRYDIAYMQCMYSSGNQIPMSGQSAPPVTTTPSDVPPPPAGTPPPPPSGPLR
jgi:hypothetical protein